MEYKSKYKKVGVLLIRIVNSNVSSIGLCQRETEIWNTFLDVGMLVYANSLDLNHTPPPNTAGSQ